MLPSLLSVQVQKRKDLAVHSQAAQKMDGSLNNIVETSDTGPKQSASQGAAARNAYLEEARHLCLGKEVMHGVHEDIPTARQASSYHQTAGPPPVVTEY